MMTVQEVSRQTGVSVRTLHYYDQIGLLPPRQVTEAGYRLYDEASLERLQQVLLYKELQFPLKDIKTILDSPDFDRNRALEQQIELLRLRKEHLENLILLAQGIYGFGVKHMNFDGFNGKKLDEYSAQAKALYGKTDAYKEFEEKTKGQSKEQQRADGDGLMAIFSEIGAIKHLSPESAEAQALIAKLQAFITDHYYTCTPQDLNLLIFFAFSDKSITPPYDTVIIISIAVPICLMNRGQYILLELVQIHCRTGDTHTSFKYFLK